MTGGWSTPPSGRGTPLGDRSASYGPPCAGTETGDRGDASEPGVTTAHGEASRRRHCWVRGVGDPGAVVPGLVLDWRRGPEGRWSGFTQYVVEGREGTRAVLEWLPADRLRPR